MCILRSTRGRRHRRTRHNNSAHNRHITIAWPVTVSAGGQPADDRCSNQSTSDAGTPATTAPSGLCRRWGGQCGNSNGCRGGFNLDKRYGTPTGVPTLLTILATMAPRRCPLLWPDTLEQVLGPYGSDGWRDLLLVGRVSRRFLSWRPSSGKPAHGPDT